MNLSNSYTERKLRQHRKNQHTESLVLDYDVTNSSSFEENKFFESRLFFYQCTIAPRIDLQLLKDLRVANRLLHSTHYSPNTTHITDRTQL
ncbi:Protein of unknown function [Cotesia congregata]|uniref:Uncharacterized protein n=1 Tax=Cotesia congregata TaxID=51543 RepID=A0A8J2HMB9_COTCN|nr:Protein of unknown function [Cotesia congregata]